MCKCGCVLCHLGGWPMTGMWGPRVLVRYENVKFRRTSPGRMHCIVMGVGSWSGNHCYARVGLECGRMERVGDCYASGFWALAALTLCESCLCDTGW